MDSFNLLQRSFHLYKTGRRNAAKSLYAELPSEFRKKVISLCLFAIEYPRRFPGRIFFKSPHGDFILSQDFLDDLLNIIPEVARNG